MSQQSRNLTPVRGPDVWLRTKRQSDLGRLEQWVVGAAGLALMAYGFRRRRTAAGAVLACLGTTALALAASPGSAPGLAGWVVRRFRGVTPEDAVDYASDLSFPASDAPAWTSTTGSGPENRR
jgi:hypothetical protein